MNILQTLLEKLFQSPTPANREALFEEFSPSMFPGRALFLDFLAERHFERQVEIAREILLRLSFDSRVFAPNKHIVNLLNAEARLAGTASREPYNGRDHFVHLVHLYLLGLYVFWYHETLHSKIREQFRQLVGTGQDRRKRGIGAFIAAWRSFVLFHDLGYPWEIAPKLDQSVEYLDAFRRAWHYATKDAAMHSMAQMLGFEWILREETVSTLEDDLALDGVAGAAVDEQAYLLAELQPETAATIRSKWGAARRLPVSADSLLPNLIRVLIPAEDLVAVLESVGDGTAVAADEPTLDTFLRRNLATDTQAIPPYTSLRIFARHQVIPEKLRPSYHWVFYVRNLESNWNAFIGRVFTADKEDATFPAFRDFCHKYLKKYPPPIAATAHLRFGDICFGIYRSLLDTIDFDLHDDGIQTRGDIEYNVIRHEQESLPSTVVNAVLGSIEARLSLRIDTLRKGQHDPQAQATTLINTPIEVFLPLLLQPLEAKSEIVQELTHKLTTDLRERIDLKRELYVLYSHIKQQVVGLAPSSAPHIFGDPTPRRAEPLLRPVCINFKENVLAEDLDRLLKQKLNAGFATVSRYKPGYAPNERAGIPEVSFSDHGFASALLFAQIYHDCMDHFYTQSEMPVGGSGLHELLSLRGIEEEHLYGAGRSLRCAAETLYTILIHNVYPKDLAKIGIRDFKTKRDREPFTYLALLCDSLQPWDRKRLYNSATGRIHYTVYAEHFNLTVLNNIIRVHEEGDDLVLDQRLQELRMYLEVYLEGVSQVIRLRLAEYKGGG